MFLQKLCKLTKFPGLRLSICSVRQCSSSNNQPHNEDPEEPLPPSGPEYPGHIETTPVQRLILAAGSSVIALADPWRADMVAVSGEVTGTTALELMLEKFHQTDEGRRILMDQPRITDQTLESLIDHPADTVGGVYYAFMAKYKLSPSARDKVQFVDDADLAYVMTRYRETHDLTHAMLEMPTNMLGEVLVKWVEAIQTRLPMCVGGALLGPIRFKEKQRQKYPALLPWAVNVGTNAAFFPAIYYEERWDQNIDEFRAEMKISEPPLLK